MDTVKRITEMADEFIWQNIWFGVLSVSRDAGNISIHMTESAFGRLASELNADVKYKLAEDGGNSRKYFLYSIYKFYTLL